MNTINSAAKAAVVKAANELLVANNTVTTLELKMKLRKDEPSFYWSQATVSSIMNELHNENMFTFKDNGTFRVYSAPVKPKVAKVKPTPSVIITKSTKMTKPTGKTISRKVALDLIQNNRGHFFTAVFTKKDGTDRVINAQYLKDQKDMSLGYVKVREASKLKTTPNDCTRNLNLQTLKQLKIAGATYNVK